MERGMNKDASNWFIRLLGVASVAHIAGNPPFGLDGLGIAILALGLVASLAVVAPESSIVRVAMGLLIVATVFLEAPVIGNHWIVAGFVALAILATSLRREWWAWFAPTGRGILLAFYSFAAFAKLNDGFFDSVQSCGLFYTNQSLASWGLPLVPSGGAGAVALAAATTIIELAVPILLVIKRTRVYGVMLGFAFHFLISLDLSQHFFDFTALLFALFTLFIDDSVSARWERNLRNHQPSLVAGAAASVLLTVAAVTPDRALAVWTVRTGTFLVWIPVGVALVLAVIRMPRVQQHTLSFRSAGSGWLGPGGSGGVQRSHAVSGTEDRLRLQHVRQPPHRRRRNQPLAGSPYRRPHRRAPGDHRGDLRAGTGGLCRARVPGPGTQRAGSPRRPSRRHVTYTVDGRTVTGTGAELGERLPVIVEKFGLFRSVDTQDPPRCQTAWLAAY